MPAGVPGVGSGLAIWKLVVEQSKGFRLFNVWLDKGQVQLLNFPLWFVI